MEILGVCGRELLETTGEVVNLHQLDLLSVDREGLLDDALAKGHLGKRDHEILDLSVL